MKIKRNYTKKKHNKKCNKKCNKKMSGGKTITLTNRTTITDIASNDQAPYYNFVKQYHAYNDTTYSLFQRAILELNSRLYNNIPSILDFTKQEPDNDISTICKIYFGDTYHDLCQDRSFPGESEIFKKRILPNILPYNPPNFTTFPYILNAYENIRVSNLEPDINTYIENQFSLRPIYSDIDVELIIRLYTDNNAVIPSGFAFNNAPLPTKRIADIVIMSNCTLKINFPKDQSVDEYVSYLQDQGKTNQILYICDFIKRYLHDYDNLITSLQTRPKLEVIKDVGIVFLFDANMSHIGKLFKTTGSNGRRVIGMACTADSASSSSQELELPNEYFQDDRHLITTNLFSSDAVSMSLNKEPGKTFGVDGISCFNLTIQRNNRSCKYVFGAKPNSYYEGNNLNEDEPCGVQGGSVPHIAKLFKLIVEANPNPNNQYLINTNLINTIENDLRKRDKFSHIPIGDMRLINLLSDSNQLDSNLLFKVLADYKRTGDYEQALTLVHKILLLGGSNPSNYTFSSVDLLSCLFARLNGLPAVYQVAAKNSPYMVLFSSKYWKASDEERELERKRQEQIQYDAKMTDTFERFTVLFNKFINAYIYFNDTYQKTIESLTQKVTSPITTFFLRDIYIVITRINNFLQSHRWWQTARETYNDTSEYIKVLNDIQFDDSGIPFDDSGSKLNYLVKIFNAFQQEHSIISEKYFNIFNMRKDENDFFNNIDNKIVENQKIRDTRVNLDLNKNFEHAIESRLRILFGTMLNSRVDESKRTHRRYDQYLKTQEKSILDFNNLVKEISDSFFDNQVKTEFDNYIETIVKNGGRMNGGGMNGGGMNSGGEIMSGGIMSGGQKITALNYKVIDIVQTISGKCFDYIKCILGNTKTIINNQNLARDFIYMFLTSYSISNRYFLVDIEHYLLNEIAKIDFSELETNVVQQNSIQVLFDILFLVNGMNMDESTKNYAPDIMKYYMRKIDTGVFEKLIAPYVEFVTLNKITTYGTHYSDVIDCIVINALSLFTYLIKDRYNNFKSGITSPIFNMPVDIDFGIIGSNQRTEINYYTIDGHSLIWIIFNQFTGIHYFSGMSTSTRRFGMGGNKTRKKRKNKKQGGTKRVRG